MQKRKEIRTFGDEMREEEKFQFASIVVAELKDAIDRSEDEKAALREELARKDKEAKEEREAELSIERMRYERMTEDLKRSYEAKIADLKRSHQKNTDSIMPDAEP